MATKKITQSVIKQMVKTGAAIDIDKMKKRPKTSDLKCIGISHGTYGMNGALFLHKNGKLYAIPSRSSSLFEYV